MTKSTRSGDATRHTSRARAAMRRWTSLEAVIYSSIGRAVMRRPAIPAGGKGFGYHSGSMTLLIIFIVLSTVEIFVVDLIVHRWLAVRVVLLIVGVWGVVWMIGLLCAHLVRPHTVGPDGVRVRDGLDLDVHVPWEDVHSVAIRRLTNEPKSPRIIDTGEGMMLAVRVADATNIEIVLERATAVQLPGSAPKGGEQLVSVVRLWTDDPRGFLAEVGTRI